MEIKESLAFQDGLLHGEYVDHYQKTYDQISSIFKTKDPGLENTILYEVYSLLSENEEGKLNYGITRLYPLCVNGECNMTRGHFHANREYDEIYMGISGNGYLLLMDEHNKCWLERVKQGSVHRISGHTAHRLINIGDCELLVGCCWNGLAGHDYQAIEEHPFGVRIYKTEKGIEIKEEV